LRPEHDIFGGSFWPTTWTLRSYTELLSNTLFVNWMQNSIIVTVVSTVIGVFLCSLAGYAFAKYRFKGDTAIFSIIMITVSVPVFTTVIPLYTLMAKFGILDTPWALILPFSVNAFGIMFIREYMHAIPSEIIDAGRIDGCSEFAVWWRLILPISKPAMATVAIFLALNSWNSYIWPLIMLQTPRNFTFTVGVAGFTAAHHTQYGLLAASAILSILPMFIFFYALQGYFVKGLTAGSAKG
jgi:ABC-type glycerol-3-phosphate transport system permease component